MKKIIAFMLTVSMILSLASSTAFATIINQENEIRSSDFWCSQPAELNNLLFPQTAAPNSASNVPAENSIQYMYEITNVSDDTATVDITFTILNGSQEYTISASTIGEIRALTADCSLLEANPKKELTLNGRQYLANIGFTSILERDGARISVVLSSLDATDTSNGPILMHFGTPVLTEDLWPYLSEMNQPQMPEPDEAPQIAPMVLGTIDSFFPTELTFFSNSTSSKSAQSLKVGLDRDHYCLAVSLSSRGANAEAVILEQLNNSAMNALAVVSSFDIGLYVDNGPAYIAGIEEMNSTGGTGSRNTVGTALLDLIESVLSDFGYPAATISTLLRLVSGQTFIAKEKSSTSHFNVSWSSFSGMGCFDSAAIPVVFQISEMVSGTSNFRAYSNISYKVLTYLTGVDDAISYYLDANTATSSFSINR